MTQDLFADKSHEELVSLVIDQGRTITALNRTCAAFRELLMCFHMAQPSRSVMAAWQDKAAGVLTQEMDEADATRKQPL